MKNGEREKKKGKKKEKEKRKKVGGGGGGGGRAECIAYVCKPSVYFIGKVYYWFAYRMIGNTQDPRSVLFCVILDVLDL